MKTPLGLIFGGVALFAMFFLALASEKAAAKEALVLNGLGMYGPRGPMGEIADLLENKGYKVTILPHTEGKRLKRLPDLLVGHSMGGNAALKAAHRLATKTKRRITVVTIDPGRAPLFHRCHVRVRCVNIYSPWHPIGGQHVVGAKNIQVSELFIHSFMPRYEAIQKLVIREVSCRKYF